VCEVVFESGVFFAVSFFDEVFDFFHCEDEHYGVVVVPRFSFVVYYEVSSEEVHKSLSCEVVYGDECCFCFDFCE